ncbi:MAG TPA: hypothetical protein PKA88_20200 [Polyangiaceae bacterium]|nr:hypothetical protein [Polyangiaceae bacterium]
MPRLARACLAVACAAAASLPLDALAQETSGFGTERPLVVSLEHLGGAVATRFEADGADESTTAVHVGTFLGPFFGQTPTSRIGVHYFLAPPISVGGLFTYSDNDSFGETLLLGARVGAALPLGSSLDLWLRGGIHYFRSELSAGSTTTFTDVRPGGEVLLALTPLEHFGFLLGGMFEVGIAGKTKSESRISNQTLENDFNYAEYGLTFGVFANF